MIVKQIIKSNAGLTPNEQNKTLTVTLHALSANRFNNATQKLATLLTETQTVFPRTDLRFIFKCTSI